MPDDRDRPPHVPPTKPNESEGAVPKLTFDGEPAAAGHAMAARYRQLHGLPRRQIEAAARGDAGVGPERLDGNAGCRALSRRDPLSLSRLWYTVPPTKGGITYDQCTVHRCAGPPHGVPGFDQPDV